MKGHVAPQSPQALVSFGNTFRSIQERVSMILRRGMPSSSWSIQKFFVYDDLETIICVGTFPSIKRRGGITFRNIFYPCAYLVCTISSNITPMSFPASHRQCTLCLLFANKLYVISSWSNLFHCYVDCRLKSRKDFRDILKWTEVNEFGSSSEDTNRQCFWCVLFVRILMFTRISVSI